MALSCDHSKPGTFIRNDLIQDYARRDLCCKHGYMTYKAREYRDLIEHGSSDVRNMRP